MKKGRRRVNQWMPHYINIFNSRNAILQPESGGSILPQGTQSYNKQQFSPARVCMHTAARNTYTHIEAERSKRMEKVGVLN
jgi:hypothetical protein